MSPSIKLFLGTAFVVVASLGGTLYVAGRSAGMTADATVTKALTDAVDQVDTQLEERRSALTGQAEVFAKDPDFRAIVERNKPGDLFTQAQAAATQAGANWVEITTAAGIRVARSNDPHADTVDISSSPFVAAALAGNSKGGYATDRGRLTQVAAVPILASAQNHVTGVLIAVRSVDSTFAASLKAAAGPGVDIALYAFDTLDHAQLTASTIGRGAGLVRQVGSLTRAPRPDPARPDSLRRETAVALDITVGGTDFAALGEPLRSASGTQVGGFVVLRDKNVEMAGFDQLRVVILGIGALGLFVAAFLSFSIGRGFTRPVAQLADATTRAAEGDYSADIGRRNGSMGALATALRALLADLRGRQELGELLAAAGASAGAAPTPAPPPAPTNTDARGAPVPGQRFADRYEILVARGAGGTGTLFKAVDAQLRTVVAIRTISRDALGADGTSLERFKSEIRLARRIAQRNVVRTHDLGEFSGVYYITMEYVEGTTLEALLLQHRPLSVVASLAVGRQLCRALEAAHAEGVIHGTVTPRTIVIAADGVLKVAGFGFARSGSDEGQDIRSAAGVIYECLTGTAPFPGNAGATGGSSADASGGTPETPMSRNPGVPRALSELVMLTLVGKPSKRPQSARELHDLLAAIG